MDLVDQSTPLLHKHYQLVTDAVGYTTALSFLHLLPQLASAISVILGITWYVIIFYEKLSGKSIRTLWKKKDVQ